MHDPLLRIRIKGFKSIRDLDDLHLRRLNVLIGANGSGKSNFISFFNMLSAMLNDDLQTFVGRAGGPPALLYRGRKHTSEISAELYFGNNGYGFKLQPTADNRLMFENERTYFKGVYWENKAPWDSLGKGHFEALLPATRSSTIA
jgi:predicted ATPase